MDATYQSVTDQGEKAGGHHSVGTEAGAVVG